MQDNKVGATTPQDYLYAYDVHGSVSMLLNDGGTTSAPTVKATYGYDAYGDEDKALTTDSEESSGTTGNKDPLNSFRYTAKRFDTGSDSLDMGARRFSPDVGRFMQRDQYLGALSNLGLGADPLTQNRYSLAGGNPLSFIESDGHRPVADGRGTAGAAVSGGGGNTTPNFQVMDRNGGSSGGGSGGGRSVNAAEGPVDPAGVKRAMYSGCEAVCPGMLDDIQRYELSRVFARSGLQMHCSANCPDLRSSPSYEFIAGDLDNCLSGLSQAEPRGSCGLALGGGLLRILRKAKGLIPFLRGAENLQDVTRSLDDLDSLRGATPEDVRNLVPQGWVEKPLRKGEGTRFLNERTGQAIFIENGWPGAVDPLHAGPYVKISMGNGPPVRLPLAGNPTLEP